ncbi:hepatocellular carcinoma-associated antigen 59-domain-containing protein [Hypoxylon sp. FL1284]|nr:hepatocellular carcinoma-associated antigen 59-domain-containing protein [Hypoxylon sp. FL1284]
MDSASSEVAPEPQVVFRGKKRKTYRQRTESNNDDTEPKITVEPSSQDTPSSIVSPKDADTIPLVPTRGDDAAEGETGLSVAEVLRLRSARKSRLGGVKFGAGNTTSGDAAAEALDELSLMIREEESKALDVASSVKNRFAPQTGLAADIVNKHMEEYIEAQLARRHNAVASSSSSAGARGQSSSQELSQGSEAMPTTTAISNTTALPRPQQRNRALQGQLMEIDLGDEARSRNEQLTERATRRLQGEAVEDEEQQPGRPRKVRLGRDGKPWRSRNRRNSDDIKRDQLVEEILRESKVDNYETPPPPLAGTSGTAGAGAEEEAAAADDRIAEEFRREFMDAMAERHKKRKKASNAPPGPPKGSAAAKGGAKDDEVLRGPKLGGSRNVRAAMRNILLEKAKEAKRPR